MVEWRKYHFGQAQETDLSSTTWEDILENSKIQNEILNGSFNNFKNLSKESIEFIQALRISREDLKNSVKMSVALEKFKS